MKNKILIVEDGIEKFQNISSLLKAHSIPFRNESLITYLDCWKELNNNFDKYSALILDMALPRFEGELPYKIAGYDILKRLKYENKIIPTIILTGYESFTIDGEIKTFQEIKDEIENNFDTIKVEVVYYRSSHTDWEDSIISFLQRGNKV